MVKENRRYSALQKILWLIAGSEISVLKNCPNDYNRHANIGFMILMTTLFAGITSYVAGVTFAKDSILGVLGFSLIWSLLIFALDRSMVNSIKRDPNANEDFNWGYFAPRLVLAIILSFFMSIALDHIVFEERIRYQMSLNNDQDLIEKQNLLINHYSVNSDSANLRIQEGVTAQLDSVLNKGCESCPKPDYISAKKEADRVIHFVLPGLRKQRTDAEREFNQYFSGLREKQSMGRDSLIAFDSVVWDRRLIDLNRLRRSARQSYAVQEQRAKNSYSEAKQICDAWLEEQQQSKSRAMAIRDSAHARLTKNNSIIAAETEKHDEMLSEMQGFDTQFATLFLMPDWGVQVLKWLIFLALLVIEILPTFLKLKTPVGQYDWEMYKRDKETEIEAKSRVETIKQGLSEIEAYRVQKEVEMNQRLVDNLVVIEERLANEMLVDWEAKARDDMKDQMKT
jgi:hypothetical protein